MSTRQNINGSRLGPTIRPFSPQHRFGATESMKTSTHKTFGSNSLSTNIQLFTKENLPFYNKEDIKMQAEIDSLNSQLVLSKSEFDNVYLRYECLQREHIALEQQLGQSKNFNQQSDNVYYEELQQARFKCDEWKQRCQELEILVRDTSRSGNDNMVTLKMEIQRLSGMKQTTENKDSEIELLRGQIKDYRNQDTIDQFTNELKQKNEQYVTLENQLKYQQGEASHQSKVTQQKLRDAEFNCQQMSAEVDRLQQYLRQRSEEQQIIRSQFESMQAEISRLNNMIIQKNIQLEQPRTTDRSTNVIQSYEIGIKEYELRLVQTHVEIQRLQDQIKQQVVDQNLMLESQESEYFREVETWKKKFCELNRTFHQLQEHTAMCSAELEASNAKQYKNKPRP